MQPDFVRKHINVNAFSFSSFTDGIFVSLELFIYSVFIYKITMSGFSRIAKGD